MCQNNLLSNSVYDTTANTFFHRDEHQTRPRVEPVVTLTCAEAINSIIGGVCARQSEMTEQLEALHLSSAVKSTIKYYNCEVRRV